MLLHRCSCSLMPLEGWAARSQEMATGESLIRHQSLLAGCLPDWMWAYDYAHNVNREGVPIPGVTGATIVRTCQWKCFQRRFMRSLYASLLFWLLWSIRESKVNGAHVCDLSYTEWYWTIFIEKIRVNTRYDILAFTLHSRIDIFLLVVCGVLLYLYAPQACHK